MSNITSTIVPNNILVSSLSGAQTLNSLTTNVVATTLSQLTDVDLQGVTNGSVLIYDTNEFVSRTLTGAISVNANGLTSVNSNAITLGTHTTGSYVATVSGTANQIIATGSGSETANVTLSLPQSIGTTSSPTFAGITIAGAITNAALTSALDGKQPVGNYAIGGGTAIGSNTGDQDLSGLVPKSTTVNGKALNTNITLNKTDVGLSAVDNTADAAKPVSTAQQTELNLKANLADPTFTGIPNAPTAAVDTSTTQIATTAYAKKEADDAQAAAVQRSNHTGTQSVSTITGLGTLATQSGTFSGTSSGTNTGDQDLSGYALKSEVFDGYDYEIHVSQVDGDDTTGNGDLLTPVASITKALTLVGSARKTIIVHPGTYTENPSITVQYTTITGPGLIGGNIVIAGTLSTSTGCTIAGLKMTNLTVTASAGTGNVNILNCEISGTFTKNSNATYTTMRLCDMAAANITGSGLVSFFGGNPNLLTVNNAAANVIVKGAVSVSPTLTAGSLNIVDSVVVASGTYAISSAASSFITVANSQILVSALNNVAPVSLLGFYSIFNCVYNKPGSILAALSGTGGSTNSIDYFQYINADKFITQGGTSSQFVKGDGSLDSVAKANLSGATFSGAISATNLSGTNTGDQDLSALVPKSTTVNGKALSTNITLNKDDVGLANVDNTSDASKPVSTAQQTALDLKANLAGATFSGAIGATNLSGTNTGDQTITLTSDVTGSGTGSFATTIATGAVSLAKMANVASSTIFYRTTSGAGAPEVQTLATLKTDLGLSGTNSGDQDLTALVPYTGATGAVNLGSQSLTAGTITSNGNTVATVVDPVRTTLTGNGVLTTFAISGASGLVNPSALIVAIDGAMQEPTVDYTVGSGQITFTSPLANGSKAVVISPTNILQISQMIPSDGSVSSSKLANDLEISGIVGFNSTTRPTSDGTGTPTGISLVTLSDVNTLYDWIPLPPPTGQFSASGGATNVYNYTTSGSTAGGIGTWAWYGSGYRPVWLCLGTQTNNFFDQRIRIAFRLGLDAAAGTGRIRFLTNFPATSLESTPTIKTIGFEIIGTTLKAAVFGVTYNVDSGAGFTVASNYGGRGYDVVLDYQAPTLNIYVDGSLVSSVSNGPTGAITPAVNQQAIFQSHNAAGGAGNACAALIQNVRYKIN